MFGLVSVLVSLSGSVSDTARMEGISLDVSFKKVSIIREEKPLTTKEGSIILLDTMKCKRNVKPNPDLVVVDSRF